MVELEQLSYRVGLLCSGPFWFAKREGKKYTSCSWHYRRKSAKGLLSPIYRNNGLGFVLNVLHRGAYQTVHRKLAQYRFHTESIMALNKNKLFSTNEFLHFYSHSVEPRKLTIYSFVHFYKALIPRFCRYEWHFYQKKSFTLIPQPLSV